MEMLQGVLVKAMPVQSGQEGTSEEIEGTAKGKKDNLKHTHIVDLPNSTWIIDEDIYTLSNVRAESDGNIYLFAVNNSGTLIRKSSVAVWSFKVYRENVLIRDMIPCYRKSDGEIGLYDVVTSDFLKSKNLLTKTKN